MFGDIRHTGMSERNRAGVPNWMSPLGPVLESWAQALDLTLGNVGEVLKDKESHARAKHQPAAAPVETQSRKVFTRNPTTAQPAIT